MTDDHALDAQLAALDVELPAGQRRVVDVLLADRSEAAFLGAEEVAARAGVSVSTTVRLAQRLGYDGYPALRSALQGELRSGDSLGRRVRELRPDRGVLDAVLQREQAALAEVGSSVEEADVRAAAMALRSARRVYLHGRGHSVAIVELLQRRLRRLGLDVARAVGDGRDLAEQLHTMTGDDALVVLALRNQPPRYRAVVEHAKRAGSTTIAVSDAVGPLLRPAPDHLIAASRGGPDAYLTIVTPILLAEVLALATARLDPDAADSLDDLQTLIDRFGE